MLMHVLSLGSVGSFGSCAQQLQVVTCKKGREEQDKRLVGGLSPISWLANLSYKKLKELLIQTHTVLDKKKGSCVIINATARHARG